MSMATPRTGLFPREVCSTCGPSAGMSDPAIESRRCRVPSQPRPYTALLIHTLICSAVLGSATLCSATLCPTVMCLAVPQFSKPQSGVMCQKLYCGVSHSSLPRSAMLCPKVLPHTVLCYFVRLGSSCDVL